MSFSLIFGVIGIEGFSLKVKKENFFIFVFGSIILGFLILVE